MLNVLLVPQLKPYIASLFVYWWYHWCMCTCWLYARVLFIAATMQIKIYIIIVMLETMFTVLSSKATICIASEMKDTHITNHSQRCSLSVSLCEVIACSASASDLLTVAAFGSCLVLDLLSWSTACGSETVSMPCICADDCWMVSTSLSSSASFHFTAASRLQMKLTQSVYDTIQNVQTFNNLCTCMSLKAINSEVIMVTDYKGHCQTFCLSNDINLKAHSQ